MSDENPHKGGNEETVEERPDKASSVEAVAGASDINQGSSPVTRPGWLSSPPPTKPQDEALMRALAKINAIDDEPDNSSTPSISPVISPVQRSATDPSSVRTWAPNPELFSSRRSTAGPLGSAAGPPNISNPKSNGMTDNSQQPSGSADQASPGEPPATSYPPPSWRFGSPSTIAATNAQPQPPPQSTHNPLTNRPSEAAQLAMQSLFSPNPSQIQPAAPLPEKDTILAPTSPWNEPPSAPPFPESRPESNYAQTGHSQGPPAPYAESASPRPATFPSEGDFDGEESSNPADYSYPIPSYTTIDSSPANVNSAPSPDTSTPTADDDIETGVSKIVRISEPTSSITEILGPDFEVNADEIDPEEFILDERKEAAFPNMEKRKRSDLGPGVKFTLVGQVLYDSYTMLDGIGESASCEVYSAIQLKNDAVVAIKTPKSTDSVFLRNFGDAAKTHGKLKHPNIVRSLAYLETGQGQPFYVMENVGGVTLEEILTSVGKLDDEEAIAMVLVQAAAALEYAHQKEIFHGRLTPHNILMADQDDQLQAKLMDFQLASVCATANDTTNISVDDPYLSPETHRGHPFSPRSDIYSLGAIAYRLSTGIILEKTVDTSLERNLEPVGKFSPDLKLAHQLDEIIQQALEPEPSYRFENASGFKAAVHDWIQKVREEFDLTDVATGDDGTMDPETGEFVGATGLAVSRPSSTAEAGTPKDSTVRRKKRTRRRKGQIIRTTIHQLVELKRRQHNQEQTAVMRFTESVSVKGPRQSPLVSLVKLIVAITIFAGLGLGSAYFIVSNPERVKSAFTEASRRLSSLLPGGGSNHGDKGSDASQLKVGIEPMIKASTPTKLPPKPRTRDIHATAQFWAIPEEKRHLLQNQSPSFGVTNNWQGKKKDRSNRRTIYRLDGKP